MRGNEKTLKMCEFEEIERPIVLQLFGGEPATIARAAQILVGKGSLGSARDDSVTVPDGIDVNMGCPVPKIASRGHAGADLMRDPERAVNIVKALKNANLGVPVSVKTRLGWASEGEILRFAPLLEQAGVDALTIHGRTKKQGYSGQADWEMIGKVVKLLSIPVIANGDIKNGEDIKKCLEITGADGVMIGRAALGNPWLLSVNPDYPEIRIVKEVVLRHAELHLERYGDGGMVTFRKHLLYYFKGFDGAVELRRKLVRVETMAELRTTLDTCRSLCC